MRTWSLRTLYSVLALILTICFFGTAGERLLTAGGRGLPSQESSPIKSVELTAEESAWLRDHPRIRVAQDPAWPPVEFTDPTGSPSGMSEDYLKLIEQRLGIRFERTMGLSWQESYVRLKQGDLDMTTCVAETPERAAFWAFTKPYLTTPIIILTRLDVPYINSLRELKGEKVAVVEDYVSEEWIKRDFPEIRLVLVKNVQEGFKLVKNGEVEALIDNMLVIGYYLTKEKISDLKIAGQTPYINAQSMAVRKDWAPLAGILQKALDSITEGEAAAIYEKWVPIRYETGIDLRWLVYLLAAFGLILAGLLAWIRKMRREIRRRLSAEAVAVANEARFKSVFEAANVGKSMTLPTGQINVNEAFCRMLGYTREKLDGKTWQELTPPEDIPAIEKRLIPLLQGTIDSARYEKRYVHKNGSFIWGDVSTVMYRDSAGHPLYFITTVIDITERKKAEEAIQTSLREKETILREIHHRVKNNLQVISSLFNLQADTIKDKDILRLFKEGQNRIRSMSLIHEKLYEFGDLTQVGFASYLKSLTAYLFQFFRINPERIRFETNLDNVRMDINTAIPCGLLANELISNTLKHAFPGGRPGRLLIKLKRGREGTFEMTVADDGIGLPPELDILNAGSFGFQVIQALIGQLDGTLSLDRENGTAFTVKFRELEYKKRI